MKTGDNKIPYDKIPTYCLKIKSERIDGICERIAEKTLTDDDLIAIRLILRETQRCIDNLYNERVL